MLCFPRSLPLDLEEREKGKGLGYCQELLTKALGLIEANITSNGTNSHKLALLIDYVTECIKARTVLQDFHYKSIFKIIT
jgi:hypothetical protein